MLVGHSMGGNVALLYAGIRPQRVRAVVNLEGFGLRATQASQAPGRYAQWLDELRRGAALRDYASAAEVADRLRRNNPRLGDPAHRIVNPTLYRVDEVLACWQQIACPVLWVRAADTDVLRHVSDDPAAALKEVEQRRRVIADVESLVIDDAGHMVHHDQPERIAAAIADFVARRVQGAGR